LINSAADGILSLGLYAFCHGCKSATKTGEVNLHTNVLSVTKQCKILFVVFYKYLYFIQSVLLPQTVAKNNLNVF